MICNTVKMIDLHVLVNPVIMLLSRTVKDRYKSLYKYYFGQEPSHFLLFASLGCQDYEYMELYLHSSYMTSWYVHVQLYIYLCSEILNLQGRNSAVLMLEKLVLATGTCQPLRQALRVCSQHIRQSIAIHILYKLS